METTLNIGGIVYIGFDDTEKYMLVVTHSGRGVYQVGTWDRVSREPTTIYPADSEMEGIGPLSGKLIRVIEKDYDADVNVWKSPCGSYKFSYDSGLLCITENN